MLGQIEKSGSVYKMELNKLASDLSYSASLGMAMKLVLSDAAFAGDPESFSRRFIKAARFLKANAPHSFQIREMGTADINRMDRWLWDILEGEIAPKMSDGEHQGTVPMVAKFETAVSVLGRP